MTEIGENLRAARSAMSLESKNLPKAGAIDGFGERVFTVSNSTSQGGQVMGGTKTVTMRSLDTAGEIVSTGRSLDIATSGHTMLAVRDAAGNIGYTRTVIGDFDSAGRLVSASNGGAFVMGRMLTDGKVPNDMGNIGALDVIRVPQQLSAAKATTSVSVRMNLSSEQEKLHGAGEVLHFLSSGVNSGTRQKEIILPAGMGSEPGALNFSDSIKLKADDGTQYTFEYGGVSVTRAATSTNNLFGAQNQGSTFTFANSGNLGTSFAVDGTQGIKVTIGGVNGQTYRLMAKSGGTASQNQFDSLAGLASLLKNIGLNARVEDNRLYVSADDPKASVAFEDIGNIFVKEAGLADITASNTPNTYRFNTLDQLQRAIKSAPGLDAKIVDGGVDFFAAQALAKLNVQLATAEWQTSHFATKGTGEVAGNNTITVTHASHGLITGDLIRVNGATGGADLAADVYRVVKLDDDHFALHATNAHVTPGGAGLGAAALTADYAFGADGLQWQKVAGRTFAERNLVVTAVEADGTKTKLTCALGAIANDDIVFISGIGSGQLGGGDKFAVPDGYYKVEGAAGGKFSIAAVEWNDVTIPAGAAYANGGTVTKVSGAPGALRDSQAVHIDNGSNTVRVYSPTATGLQKNGYIKFKSLAALTVDLGNGAGECQVTQDKAYKITATGNDATLGDYFEFEADGIASGAAVERGYAELGPDYYIDTYSKMAAELSLDDAVEDFQPTYASTDQNKSLAIRAKKHDANVRTEVMRVVDSQGIAHSLGLTFAKLDENYWAVEVHGIADSNGVFDFKDDNRLHDGGIADGYIRFDSNGNLVDTKGKIEETIVVNWKNGSAPSNISINWGAIGGFDDDGRAASPSVTQQGDRYEKYDIADDGILPSRPTSVEITKDGFVTVKYADGTSQAVAVVAAAHFRNINGLMEAGNGTYIPSSESGDANLGAFEEDSLHGVLSFGALGSNVDKIDVMINIQDQSQLVQVLGAAEASSRSTDNDVIRKLTQ